MLSKNLLSLSFLALATAVQDAPIISTNVPGLNYVATLPESAKTTIRGYISATSNHNGTGVVFSTNFHDFPTSGGPFIYHIHDKPVPSDGNCTSTGPHLDPFARGEDPPCKESESQTCQVGDLAGKHGHITSDPWQKFYLDLFTSTTPGSQAFFGNRSVVIHSADKTRLTCANFEVVPCAEGGDGAAATATVSSIEGATATATATAYSMTIAAPASSSMAAMAGMASGSGSMAIGTGTGMVPAGTSTAPITQVTGGAVRGKEMGWAAVGVAAVFAWVL